MQTTPLNFDQLTARKLVLEQRIKGYKESVAVLAGPCSRSSLSKRIEECEMELEQIRSLLGEI